MIDPSVLLALETKNEIRVAVKLSASDMPMRHKDISDTLKINRQRCTEAIKSLVEKRIIVEAIMFGVTVYSVPDKLQNESAEIQNESTRTQNAPVSSPFCGESAVNMLTCVNTTNTTNKKDSEISLETQASAETPPGKAGSADEAELIPPASSAPADSPHRTSAAAKTCPCRFPAPHKCGG